MGFLLFGIIIVVFFTTSIELVINNETVLREGSQAFEWWAKPPELPMIKIYIFNVTNADEFLNNGSKPIVEELGPYVYVERWEKKNIKFHQNGTVSFNQQKIYHFDESQSSGLEDDVVVVPNIPMLSATSQSKHAARFLRLAMASIMDILKIKPFVEVSVGQLLWGYEDPLLKLAKDVVPKEQKLPYEEFGLMYKKNGTSKDTITIFTGANDITKYGLIDKWNGKTSLEHFTTYECNSVLASDGSIFPPNITKNVTLYLFDKDLCRRLPLVFDKEVKGSNDIPAYRFTPPKNVFASVEENPDNVCFCPHGPPCTPSGFHNASLCQYDSPILLSFPHFYMGNDSYRTAFDGISPPVPENHTFYIIVQPDTGTAMAVKQRIQINLAVSHVEDIEQVENFPDIVFPIMWYEEGFSSLPKEMTEHMSLTTSVPPIAKPLPKEMTEDVSLTTSVPPIAKPLPKEMTEDVSLMTSVPPIAKPLPKEMTEDVSLTTSVPPIAKPLPKEMTEDMSLTTSVPPIAKPLPKEMTEDVSLTTSVPPIAKPLPKETIEEMSLTSVPPIAKPLPKEMTEDMSLTTSVPPIVKPLAKETTEPTSLTRSVPPIAKLLPKEMTEDVSLTTSVPPIAKPLPKETIEEMALTSVPPIAKPLPKEMTEDMSLTTSVPPIVKPLAKETTEPTSLTTSVPTIAKPLPNEMTEHSSLTTSVHPRAKSSIDFEHAVLYQNNLGFRYYKKNITSTITTTN